LQNQFCIQEASTLKRHDLNKFWFYLDEVSNEMTQIGGPVTRDELRSMALQGKQLNYMCYVWHPVLGTQWVVFEKVVDIISPPMGKTDELIHVECERRHRLMNHPLPHLRGYLKVGFKGKISTKWVLLIGRYLHFSNYNVDTVHEFDIDLQECDLGLLDANYTLAIKINSTSGEFVLSSVADRGSEEMLEWFNEFRCTRYLIQVLGEDLPKPYVDQTELHISNVRSSVQYMGEKIMEGFLRKEGSVWRSVLNRWFVLRSQGLYYYTSKGEKSYKGMIPLKEARVESMKQYRYPHHFGVVSGKKTLHLWTDSLAMKDIWTGAIEKAVRRLQERSI
jgi:hypothetical protein